MGDTLIGIFLDAVAKYRKPDQFIRMGANGWESISADRALADVESLALGLEDLGVHKGDRVALLSETRYEWAVTDLATLGLGAALVTIYPTLTAAQIRYILENSEAQLLVVSTGALLEKIRDAVKEIPRIEAVICMDASAVQGPREGSFAAVQALGADRRAVDPSAFRERAAEVRPDDLATLIYTSGTTGDPKGAMLTHGNIASDVRMSLEIMPLGPGDVALSFLPLCHIFERMGGLYAMLAAGVTIAYAQNFDTVAADAVEVRPTVITAVPRFYEKVHSRVMENALKMPAIRRALFKWGMAQGLRRAKAHFAGREERSLALWLADRLVLSEIRARMGGRLRVCFSGGAALNAATMEFFFAIGIPVLEGYGLTETSPVICLNPLGRERPGSVGRAIPGVEVRIGDDGEILTRGPHVMRGYFKNDEASRAALRDGWFHTGDVGRIDDDGYLFITDRLKDLLVLAGGKKVAPQPIEARLKESAYIAEAVLLGDKRPFVVCLVAPQLGALEAEAKARGWAAPSRAELVARPEVEKLIEAEIDRVNADLAPFEKIKRFAVLEDELTQENGALTPTLKVKRKVVAARYEAMIEGLYAGNRVGVG